ncbi:uncharacterized protein LOC9647942 [Selaginella moellendorffii]|uniref:uncharacterized protein LOC9647942 n=1 Tax=Selaginella moellendorffii TaxID=88036 RepID=UPI000D1D0447|nr:uncharacterized protein LOC9647942 [Selaginella moellendorffii]|eukprot:XP_024542371.1 uncharacterized protein LOC9647942 [Selaginella moellendorffii]
MSRRDGSCWRHPSQRAAGVCADCLKERLSALSPSAEALVPHRASYSDRSSAFGFVALDRRNAAASRPGIADYGGQRQQQLVSPLLSDAYLRRSKSWSHWEGSSGGGGGGGGGVVMGGASNAARGNNLPFGNGNGFAGRKSDAVLDDWTRQRFFSIFAKDQSQQKKSSSACASNNRSTPQRFYGGAPPLASGMRSGGGGGGGGGHRCLASSKVDYQGEGLSSSAAAGLESGNSSSAKKTSSCKSSAWWSSLVTTFRKSKPRPSPETEPAVSKKKSTSTGSSSLAGYFNRARKEEAKYVNLAKGRASQHSPNWKQQHPQQQQQQQHSNPSWISSPLRIFKHGASSNHGKAKKDAANRISSSSSQQACDAHHHQQNQQHQQENTVDRHSSSEEPSSWSIPSSVELKKLQAATPAYTAYYRDYGAWSLSSSPVPHNRWGNANNCATRGKQPWENRDVVAHSASSPYHRLGSSTWNFYLTPLRPAKAKAAGTATTTTTTTSSASKQQNNRQ